jgi:hypothetical protein
MIQTTTLVPGQATESPRGGMPVIVVADYGATGVLTTGDGRTYQSDWCRAGHDAAQIYYEWIGGTMAGHHGWFCGTCRAITQVG